MRQKITLKTGSILELEHTSFKNFLELQKVICKHLKKNIPDFKFDSKFFNTQIISDDFFKMIIPSILDLLEDIKDIEIILKCGDNSIINDSRINLEYFEDVNNRQDYFLVLYELIKFTLQPLFPKASMKSKEEKK